MDASIRIRQARAGDWKAVERLLKAVDLPPAGVREGLEEGYAVATSSEGTDQETVIGVAGIEAYGDHGLLRSVAVRSAWQRRSVGRALIDDRLGWAQARGLADLFLITVDKAQYFKQYGFESIKREAVPDDIKASTEFASLCPLTAEVMMRRLGDSPDGSSNRA